MQSEFDGLKKVRSALAILVVSQLLAEAGGLLTIFSLDYLLRNGIMNFAYHPFPPEDMIYLFAGGLIAFIAIALYFLSLAEFRSGFKLLKGFYKNLGIGYLGANLYIVGIILIFTVPFAEALIFAIKTQPVNTFNPHYSPPPAFYLSILLITLIIALGNVFLLLGVYRIGNVYNEVYVRVGGILMIIGSIFSIVNTPIVIYANLIAPSAVLPAMIFSISSSVTNSILFFIGATFVYQGLNKIIR